MKVKQLIEALEKLPPNYEVMMAVGEEGRDRVSVDDYIKVETEGPIGGIVFYPTVRVFFMSRD